jgi:hypothetical protein
MRNEGTMKRRSEEVGRLTQRLRTKDVNKEDSRHDDGKTVLALAFRYLSL